VVISEQRLPHQASHIHRLDTLNKLPAQFLANLLPDLILLVQLFAALEEVEVLKVLVFLEELAKLIQDVCVREEVFAVERAVLEERRLDLFEHGAQFLLELLAELGGRDAIDAVDDVNDVLVVAGQLQLLEDLAHLREFETCHVELLLLYLCQNALEDLVADLGALLALALREPFVEVVDALIRIVARLLRRLTVNGLVLFDQHELLVAALRANHDAFL